MARMRVVAAGRKSLYAVALATALPSVIFPLFWIAYLLTGEVLSLAGDAIRSDPALANWTGLLINACIAGALILLPLRDSLVRHVLALLVYYPCAVAAGGYLLQLRDSGLSDSYPGYLAAASAWHGLMAVLYVETTLLLLRRPHAGNVKPS